MGFGHTPSLITKCLHYAISVSLIIALHNNQCLPIGYSVIVALTGLPIGYSVIVALTGLPIGYSVIVVFLQDKVRAQDSCTLFASAVNSR